MNVFQINPEPCLFTSAVNDVLAMAAYTGASTEAEIKLAILTLDSLSSGAEPEGLVSCRGLLLCDDFRSEVEQAPLFPVRQIAATKRIAPEGSGWFKDDPFVVLKGDSREIVKCLPLIDCVVSSPPYFRKRKYGDGNCEIGWESVADYICALVDVFEAIPLNPWASVWVNIGDTRGRDGELLGVPRRFVTEMEKRGYVLIDEVIWAKVAVQVDGTTIGHCMIEPASDYGRLNGNGFEPLFRFVKNPKEAWSDPYAVSIPRRNVPDVPYLPEDLMFCRTSTEGRNLANVWLIPPGQSHKKHWATYPASLVERPIAMTCPPAITSEGPRDRLVVKEPYDEGRSFKRGIGKYGHEDAGSMSGRHDTGREYVPRKPKTIGWTLSRLPSVPGIVLDPFCGTGTTGEVAIKLGRRFIGVELLLGLAHLKFFTSQNEKYDFWFSLSGEHIKMRYAYEVQPDGSKTVHAFPDESSRLQWIVTCPSVRGVLSGNSREVKTALYRGDVVVGAIP
jgi:DNA modification methylase